MQIIMEYGINKGIGKSVEFRGLKAQYLFIFRYLLNRKSLRRLLKRKGGRV